MEGKGEEGKGEEERGREVSLIYLNTERLETGKLGIQDQLWLDETLSEKTNQ